ncbi:eukaryotic initiation factor 4E [Oesophagostomum dentatum]|uniref:eIF-4F 25 kDa subunit n=1 Tax=Oesophagostomum dentatum TaxID=61180 RepID=A0A0B1SL48_OESDE|nr:eukaryotic initiation factor 4E [Oesophagostomum dentatum]
MAENEKVDENHQLSEDVQNLKLNDEETKEKGFINVPEPLALHPLKRKWTYWYLNDDRQANWEDRLKRVCTFSTVEEFWALYNNIRPPSGLNCLCDYNVFKDGIQPMWEVPENLKGGRWLITVSKSFYCFHRYDFFR